MSPVKIGQAATMGNITAARKHFPKLSSSQVEILYLIYRGWTWDEITRLLNMTNEELMMELLCFDIKEIEVLQIREEQNWKVQEQIKRGWG